MKFRDIPQLTRIGSYQVNVPIIEFPKWISDWQKNMGLILEPDFQRGHVWTEEQQIAYVEFLLRGGKSSRIFYLNYPSIIHDVQKGAYDDCVCVDGLQRITAILRFLNNEIPAFKVYFSSFEDQLPLKFDVLININDLKTKQEVLQWYIEINEGGTPHTKSEIDKVKVLLEQEMRTNVFT